MKKIVCRRSVLGLDPPKSLLGDSTRRQKLKARVWYQIRVQATLYLLIV